jgi:hypothetical protein
MNSHDLIAEKEAQYAAKLDTLRKESLRYSCMVGMNDA